MQIFLHADNLHLATPSHHMEYIEYFLKEIAMKIQHYLNINHFVNSLPSSYSQSLMVYMITKTTYPKTKTTLFELFFTSRAFILVTVQCLSGLLYLNISYHPMMLLNTRLSNYHLYISKNTPGWFRDLMKGLNQYMCQDL